jgi:hypothetical protein
MTMPGRLNLNLTVEVQLLRPRAKNGLQPPARILYPHIRILRDLPAITANIPQRHPLEVSLAPIYLNRTLNSLPMIAYVSRPPIMDPQYAQIGLPTSATRLNLATNWGYPQPWSDGAPGQAGPVGYQPMPHMFYYPHYRPNGSPGQPSEQHPHPHNDRKQHAQEQPAHSRHPRTSSPSRHTSHPPIPDSEESSTRDSSELPPIDPALDSGNSRLTEQQVLEITQAAMKAVLEAEAGTSSGAASNIGSASPFAQSEKDGNGNEGDEAAGGASAIVPQSPAEEQRDAGYGYGRTLERPEPMAHMLTEDGEPMLNPGLPKILFHE